jgi:hypothetical protein
MKELGGDAAQARLHQRACLVANQEAGLKRGQLVTCQTQLLRIGLSIMQ